MANRLALGICGVIAFAFGAFIFVGGEEPSCADDTASLCVTVFHWSLGGTNGGGTFEAYVYSSPEFSTDGFLPSGDGGYVNNASSTKGAGYVSTVEFARGERSTVELPIGSYVLCLENVYCYLVDDSTSNFIDFSMDPFDGTGLLTGGSD